MNKITCDYKLYLVTDRGLLAGRDLCEAVEKAVEGGVTLVQLREKDTSTLEFYNEALKLKEILNKHKVPLIINDRLDIALAIDADGLHIGQDDMPLEVARKLLGENKIIGVSTGTVEEALLAEKAGADYLGVGAVFTTTTKDDAGTVTLEELKRIKEVVSIPVVAIGGINLVNASKAIETGIDGISVVSAILCKEDIKAAAEELVKLF